MDFETDFWDVVKVHGRVAKFYKAECEALWRTYSPEQQKAICEAIQHKLDVGMFVSYRPQDAMRDNAPLPPKQIIWSADKYFDHYHTTDPTDGFRKIYLPDQHKTIYVKN